MMEEEKIYVVVGKEVEAHTSVLSWAIQNSGGKNVCIIHVLQLDKFIRTPIGFMAAENVTPAQLKAHRDEERRKMSSILDKYLQTSQKFGISLEKLFIENDSIEKGIIQLIEQHKIKILVMRGATDRQYNKTKTDLKSSKAIYVRENAPPSCLIWFICKGFLIHTRKPTPIIKGPNVEDNEPQDPTASAPPFTTSEEIPARWSFDTYKDTSSGSVSRSSSGRSEAFGATRGFETPRDSTDGTPSRQTSHLAKHPTFHSRNNEIPQGNGLQTMYIEECRRRKEVEAELEKVKLELEWIKNNEAKLPKAMEELDYMTSQVTELAKVKRELDYMKNVVLGELRSAIEQKTLLENQIRNSTVLLEMLGEKLASAITLVHNYGEQ